MLSFTLNQQLVWYLKFHASGPARFACEDDQLLGPCMVLWEELPGCYCMGACGTLSIHATSSNIVVQTSEIYYTIVLMFERSFVSLARI